MNFKTFKEMFYKFRDNINKFIDDIYSKICELKIKLKKEEKWKLYLYLNGQCVNKQTIDKDFAPMNKIYVIKVKHQKHLIGTNRKTQLVVRSYKYKYTDEIKKEAHVEVLIYEGSDLV